MSIKESVMCPTCKTQTSEALRFEGNTPWSPNVHFCQNCDEQIFSWLIYSRKNRSGKNFFPLNSFQFLDLVHALENNPRQYSREASLIMTKTEFESFCNFFLSSEEKLSRLDLVLKIYEHKTRTQTGQFN